MCSVRRRSLRPSAATWTFCPLTSQTGRRAVWPCWPWSAGSSPSSSSSSSPASVSRAVSAGAVLTPAGGRWTSSSLLTPTPGDWRRSPRRWRRRRQWTVLTSWRKPWLATSLCPSTPRLATHRVTPPCHEEHRCPGTPRWTLWRERYREDALSWPRLHPATLSPHRRQDLLPWATLSLHQNTPRPPHLQASLLPIRRGSPRLSIHKYQRNENIRSQWNWSQWKQWSPTSKLPWRRNIIIPFHKLETISLTIAWMCYYYGFIY